MFNKKELKALRSALYENDNCSQRLFNKVNKLIGDKLIDHTYTVYSNEIGIWSNKFATPEKAEKHLRAILGKWSLKTADKWGEYTFVDTEYDVEVSSYRY